MLSGEYRNGSALPSQSELMSQFGAAVQTVRGAYELLVEEGLVRVEHGRGHFVVDQFGQSVESVSAVVEPELTDAELSVLDRRNRPEYALLGLAMDAVSPFVNSESFFVGRAIGNDAVEISWVAGSSMDYLLGYVLPRYQPDGSVWGVPGLRVLTRRVDDVARWEVLEMLWLPHLPCRLLLRRHHAAEF